MNHRILMSSINHDARDSRQISDHDREAAPRASSVAHKVLRKAHEMRATSQALEPSSAHGSGFGTAINAGLIQRDGTGDISPSADMLVARAASSSGHALPDDLRSGFEQSLGTDLSGVRVHSDASAAAASESLGAHAFALGQDIYMGTGQYRPTDPEGAKLLAHEVAHTVQQRDITTGPQHKLEVSEPGDPLEQAADHAAQAMVTGAPASVSATGSGRGTALRHPNDLQRRYGVTGPAPTIPSPEELRRMPMEQLRGLIRRYRQPYGTQNAPALIAIRNAMLTHPTARRPEPLDNELLGGFDIWEMDAARYREYLQHVPHPGHVTMGEGTQIRPAGPHAPQPPAASQPAAPTPSPQQAPQAGPAPGQAEGEDAHRAAASTGHVDVGGIPHWVHQAEEWAHGIATGLEVLEIFHALGHGAAAVTAEILGPVLTVIGAALAIADAVDFDNQIAQAEGFSYGVVYAATHRAGPTRDQYTRGVFTQPNASRLDRWQRGISQGRGFVGPQHREATVRIALAMARDGGGQVLNAIFQHAIRQVPMSSAASSIRLVFPGPGLE